MVTPQRQPRQDSQARDRLQRRLDRACAAIGLLGLLVFGALTAAAIAIRGPFRYFGSDFSAGYAAGRIIAEGQAHLLFDIPTQQAVYQEVIAGTGLTFTPNPFPVFILTPAYALAYVPLVGFSLVTALVVWQAVSAAAAILGLWLLHRRAFGRGSLLHAVVYASFFPLLFGFFYGQVIPLFLFGMAMSYIALKDGRDVQGGLWATILLLFKPQFAAGFVLLLLLQRRWRALGGLVAGGLALAAVSTALSGPSWIVTYPTQLLWASRFDTGGYFQLNPTAMVSWRAFLTSVAPPLAPTASMALNAALSLGTLAVGLLPWRGGWVPATARFDRMFLAAFIATLLASVHSHMHGLVLLLPPGVCLLAAPPSSLSRRLLPVAFAIPTLAFFIYGENLPNQALVITVYLIGSLALLVAEELRSRPLATMPAPRSGIEPAAAPP